MGGGDLNLKKSWHPSTFRNQERVWKQEQKEQEEHRKLEQWKKEQAEERKKQDLLELQEQAGLVKRTDQIGWMYAVPAGAGGALLAEKEQYLLGHKRAEKALAAQEAKPAPSSMDLVTLGVVDVNNNRDLMAKVREDPLFMIRKREQDSLKLMMANPIQVKQLKEKTQLISEKKKKKKRKTSERSPSPSHHRRSDRRESSLRPSPHRSSRYQSPSPPRSHDHRSNRHQESRFRHSPRHRSIQNRSPSPNRSQEHRHIPRSRHSPRHRSPQNRSPSPNRSQEHRHKPRSRHSPRHRSPQNRSPSPSSSQDYRHKPRSRHPPPPRSPRYRSPDLHRQSAPRPQPHAGSHATQSAVHVSPEQRKRDREAKLVEMMQSAHQLDVDRNMKIQQRERENAFELEMYKASDPAANPISSFQRSLFGASTDGGVKSVADVLKRNRYYVKGNIERL